MGTSILGAFGLVLGADFDRTNIIHIRLRFLVV
jgi:hypothetical protein